MEQRIIDLYCEYVHGGMDRRSFMERLTVFTGSAAAAAAVLPLIENDMAKAITVLEADPRIKTETIPIPGLPKFTSYLVTPTFAMGKKPAKMAALVLAGENRSTNPSTKDICRRWGCEGFLTLGVDYLSPVGGNPDDQELAGQMTNVMKAADVVELFKLASKYLRSRPDVGKIGMIGFCWGGGVANDLLIEDPLLDAVVGFYGRNPDLNKVDKIRAPLLFNYAGMDQAILEGVPAYDAALTAAKKEHTFYIYPGAQHGFHNDTNAARFDAVSYQLAWERSLAFFNKHLRGAAPGR